MITLQQILREAVNARQEFYPYRSDQEWSIADALTNAPRLANGLPIEQLPVSKLVKTQSMTGPDIPPGDPIIVLDDGARLLVIDGHHRLKGAKKRNDQTIPAHVLRSSKPLTVKVAARLLGIEPATLLNAMHYEDRRKYE